MSNTIWFPSLEKIRPYIFKVKTPNGSGTGFQISYSEEDSFCGIATAYHVIAHEYEWEEPIKIIHHFSGKSVLLNNKNRAIITYPNEDLAFILFHKGELPVESKPLSLIDKGNTLKQGVEVGWCGFPSVAIEELCFFAGHVSCPLEKEKSYLVDGVAINGVSGGPVFYIQSKTQEPKFFGVVSAYRANRTTGESLPGLCVVRSVEPYQATLQVLKNLADAKRKEKEEKIKQEKEKGGKSCENIPTPKDKKVKPQKTKRKIPKK